MLWLRLALALGLGYGVLVALAWLLQERLAFPAPRAPLPDPAAAGLAGGERLVLRTAGGVPLAGWFVPPARPGAASPALLWFYGNGETIAAIAPVLREFRPPGAALLVVDYPGYGASGGRATEHGLYEAADAALAELLRRGYPAERIVVYGRSLGSAPATYTATRHDVAGLVLESPFTNAREMSGQHYGLFPRFILRLSLDNLARIRAVRCPVLVFHGTDDRIVPSAMGRRVAAAAPGPAELVLIDGAGHNDTYAVGGRSYRDRLARFVTGAR